MQPINSIKRCANAWWLSIKRCAIARLNATDSFNKKMCKRMVVIHEVIETCNGTSLSQNIINCTLPSTKNAFRIGRHFYIKFLVKLKVNCFSQSYFDSIFYCFTHSRVREDRIQLFMISSFQFTCGDCFCNNFGNICTDHMTT